MPSKKIRISKSALRVAPHMASHAAAIDHCLVVLHNEADIKPFTPPGALLSLQIERNLEIATRD